MIDSFRSLRLTGRDDSAARVRSVRFAIHPLASRMVTRGRRVTANLDRERFPSDRTARDGAVSETGMGYIYLQEQPIRYIRAPAFSLTAPSSSYLLPVRCVVKPWMDIGEAHAARGVQKGRCVHERRTDPTGAGE